MKRAALVAALTAALVAVPSVASAEDEFYGIRSTPNDELVVFDSFSTAARDVVPLTGLAGVRVVALDARWATGGLYGVTRAIGGNTLRVVRIDQSTGAVTPVGPSFTPGLPPDGVAFEVHPTENRGYVVTSSDQTFGVDLVTGDVFSVPAVNPASQEISANAWFPPRGNGIIAGIALDTAADVVRLGISGGSFDVGPLGLVEDIGKDASLDVSGDGTIFMSARVGATSRVYSLSLSDGHASQSALLGYALNAFAVRQTGRVSWAAPVQQAAEGDGTTTLTLVRESPATGPAVVRWATVNGTATAGADYNGASGLVTFGRGETTRTVTVPVVQDTAVEGPETVTLALSSDDGVAVGPAGVLRINDDDATGSGADTTKPVLVAVPLTLRPSRRIVVPFGLGEPAKVSATLTLAPRTAKKAGVKPLLATASVPSAAVGTGRLTFKVKGSVLRRLPRTAKATATVTATDGAGNTTTTTAKITLKRP